MTLANRLDLLGEDPKRPGNATPDDGSDNTGEDDE
jgi:hypothetical protein